MKNLLTAIAILAASAGALPVGSVEIEGNEFVSDSLISGAYGLAPGSAWSVETSAEGLRRIFGLGYFSGAEVLVDSSSGLVNVLLRVSENRLLSSVEFEGLDKLDEVDLRDTLMLFPGQTVTLSEIESARRLILSMLAEKHRHFATVEAEWQDPDAGGRSVLLFRVEEGPDVRVGEIDFTGNTRFSDSDLRGEMKTKQDSFWRSGRFRQSDFMEDLGKVERYYRDHGYPDARVTGYTRSVLEDGRHLRFEITVEEGRYYRLGDVSFTGNSAVPDSTLEKAMRMEEGDEYRISRFESSLDALYEIFQDRGFFYAEVEPSVNADTASGVIDLGFRINEGERAHIRMIEITGNTRTMDNVIRRELRVQPGDLFQRASLVRSLRNVYYLNYFDNVVPEFRSIEGSPDIDLVIDVEEKSTGKAGFGAGYGATDGFNGYLELGETNLFGRGQSVNINYQFSKRTQDIELGFTEPWFRDTPLSLGGELFHTTSFRDEYDRRRTGGAVTVGRVLPWIDYTSASVRYLLEQTDVYNITDDSTSYYYSLRDRDWPQWTSSVRFRIGRDSRDRQVFPGEGSQNILTTEFAGGMLGGDIGYQKYLLDSSWFIPSFWRFIYMVRARVGLLGSIGPDEPPAYELFELGGTGFYGVRGYPSQSIGAVEGFETVGGRSMLILTAEYRLRVIDQIQLSAFFDAGDTWNSWASCDLGALRKGAGLGIRVEVPMLGVMGLDYGYGFDGPERGWEPHFQFGADF
ncbi:outer membrane protein assembly factor BamA [Candidatus Fermentibacteria bacterium]|nr:outer membrane protein assembly factor BamA [Candidatus Fermentibacteria bacterium]